MPVTKNQIKLVRSLAQRKERNATGLFVAEGDKLVPDLFSAFHCQLLIATAEFLQKHPNLKADEVVETNHSDIERASLLNAPQQVIALFRMPQHKFSADMVADQLTLVLDKVQDPGNLGTIVRIADWFGIHSIVCSPDTVDVFNPKTVQATMGALARVKVYYTPLEDFLKALPKDFPVFGTFLEGDNIYKMDLPQKAVVIMGNEGNGISAEVGKLVNRKLFIPSYPADQPTSESLNVAVATAITCAEFRRRTY
ncbi:MAG: RNA methyltransferase [Paludibacteraceae bacterium]|nr:RNA methyltransferase [Paludibacteraceae bacterium]